MADNEEFQDVMVNDEEAPANDNNNDNEVAPDITQESKQEVIEVDNKTNDEMENKDENKNENKKNYESINLIRPQRTSSPRILKIISTEERKGRVQKHTVYIIECDPAPQGVITVARRYNDFKWLRSVLCQQFPGIFIPPLPPANVIGRFENSFIEERRQDLERFLNRIESIQPFAESRAFGLFLQRPETTFFEGRKEIEEECISFRSEEDIALILCKLFPDLDEEELDEEKTVHENDIPKLKEFLTKIDLQMNILNKSAIRLFKHLNFVSKEMLLFTESFDGLYSSESNYPYKATSERLDVREQFKLWSIYQTKQTDSYYDNFFRSLRYEQEDIKALLELFKYHEDLYKKYNKVLDSINKWKEIEDQGKELQPKQERQKGIDLQKRKELLTLLNIVTKIILKNEIILIWNNKTTQWRDKIEKFAKIQTEITNKMLRNWKNIAVIDDNDD